MDELHQIDEGVPPGQQTALVPSDSAPTSEALLAAGATSCAVALAMAASVAAHRDSCGKCTFGREGTRQLTIVLGDLIAGKGSASDIDLLLDLCDTMHDGSLCEKGRNIADAVLAMVRHYRADFDAHANKAPCSMQQVGDIASASAAERPR